MLLGMFSRVNPSTRAYDAAGNVVQINASPSVAQRATQIVSTVARLNPFAPATVLKPAAEGAKLAGAGVKSAGEGLGKAASAAGRGIGIGFFVVVVLAGLIGLAYFGPLLSALRR